MGRNSKARAKNINRISNVKVTVAFNDKKRIEDASAQKYSAW